MHAQVLDTANVVPIKERTASGGEVWWYVNYDPPRPYGNFFIDFAGVEHRILFWQAWGAGIEGFHYWSVNHARPGQDPRRRQLDVTPVNGDGFLVYPGEDGPVNSVRWEIIRDGIEDYGYLVLLAQRLGAVEREAGRERAAEAWVRIGLPELLTDLTNFARDPGVLLRKRLAVARMLEELGRSPGGLPSHTSPETLDGLVETKAAG